RVRPIAPADDDLDSPRIEEAPRRAAALPAWLLDQARRGAAPDPILEVRGLARRFGGVVALADVDLVVPRGAVIGLIGPNGAGKAQDLARNLPYGDQRRLEIARALASEPRLLLLDEPTAGMNPRETENLTTLIGSLRRELELAILLIEHDMEVVMGISDRITVLDYGVRIAEGTP